MTSFGILKSFFIESSMVIATWGWAEMDEMLLKSTNFS